MITEHIAGFYAIPCCSLLLVTAIKTTITKPPHYTYSLYSAININCILEITTNNTNLPFHLHVSHFVNKQNKSCVYTLGTRVPDVVVGRLLLLTIIGPVSKPVISNTVVIIAVCVKVANSTFLVTNKRTKWSELSRYYLYNSFVR